MPWILYHKSGEQYPANFHPLTRQDMIALKKKYGWSKRFHWDAYFHHASIRAYKLVVDGDTKIQGLIAMEPIREHGYVYVDLVEKAPHNRKPNEEFLNVGDVLFGYACKMSIDNGLEGYVMLYAKTMYVDHYQKKYGMTLIHPRERKMAFDPVVATRLVRLYYK